MTGTPPKSGGAKASPDPIQIGDRFRNKRSQLPYQILNKAVEELKKYTGFCVNRDDFGWMEETRIPGHNVLLIMQQLRHKNRKGILDYDEVLFTLETQDRDLVAKLGCWCVYPKSNSQWLNLDEG